MDAIRLTRVSFGFIDVPRRWRRLIGWIKKPVAPRSEDDLDDIMVWYLLNGYELKRSLYRLGLEPMPLPEDEEDDGSWEFRAAEPVIPPTFGTLLKRWLGLRQGRRLWREIDNHETTMDCITELARTLARHEEEGGNYALRLGRDI